jgi:iduronate 2-sulfatase
MIQDPEHKVRSTAFSVAPSRKGFLLRDDQWAYIQYGEDAGRGIELFDMKADLNQYTNLAQNPAHQKTVTQFKARLATKLKSLRDNDLRRQK